MKRRVKVGKQFDIDKVRIIDTRTRSIIAISILVICAGAILGSAAFGVLYDSDFGKLQAVWSAVGPVLGLVGGYYFKSSIEG